jgi:RimJ/RimL family protein N-acetyltransferase
MSTAMPILTTERLTIRPFVLGDLSAVDVLLSAAWEVPLEERAEKRREHERWLAWSVASYVELANLDQPPYGDRAVVRNEDGQLVGCVGLVPSLGPFGQLPGFPGATGSRHFLSEVGLYWTVNPVHQGHGYATEAARALIDFCFRDLGLARVVATTRFDNGRSMAVMRNLGMRILRNPESDPAWFQIVGVLEQAEK